MGANGNRSSLSTANVSGTTQALAWIAILLLPFQDSPLVDTQLGSVGQTLSIFPVLTIAAIWLLMATLVRPSSVRVPAGVLLLAIYVILLTVYGMAHFGWQYKGISLLSKAGAAAVHWTLLVVGFWMGAGVRREQVHWPLRWAFALNAGGYVAFNMFLGRDAREVAFSAEPSHFGVLTACLGTWLMYATPSKVERVAVFALMMALLYVSGSKGAAVCVAGTGVVVALFRARMSLHRRMGTALVVLALSVVFTFVALSAIEVDLTSFASTATRVSGAVTALLIGSQYPLGVGLGGFFPAFAESVPQSWTVITDILGTNIDMSELFKLAFSSDRNVSAKSFALDTLIYFGWPGLIALMWGIGYLSWRSLRRAEPEFFWLSTGIVFAGLSITSYYTVMPFFVVPMFLGFAYAALAGT